MARRRSSPTEGRAGSFRPTTRTRSSTRSLAPLGARRNAGRGADARRQTAADTAGRRSLVASPPCTRSCSPPLPGSRLRGGGALDPGRLTPYRSTSRSPISQRLPRISNTTGRLSLALGPKPLVVQSFDGVVERPQSVASAIRDAQRVINGLGSVSAQGDRVVGVLDQPQLDRIGDGPRSCGSFGDR